MIRVLALVPYPVGRVPGQRYRIEQWAPFLGSEGIEVAFSSFLSAAGMDVLYRPGHLWTKALETARGYGRRLAESLRPGAYDVAFVFRETALLGPISLERWIARRFPVVYDFDDAIYLPASSPANAWAAALKSPNKAAALCRRARHVTVGNEILAQFARPLAHAVTLIPSTIDTDAYVVRERAPNPRPIVGWTGSTTTVSHLQDLAAVLARVRRVHDYELRVIGGQVAFPGVDLRLVPWRADSEVEDLRPIDVGLMPLPDDAWSRGKCGMKALQYMALGIPPVVSPVGANATIVQDGVNGFHARSEEEWVQRIVRLIEDPALRARLGAAARRTVEEQYSARIHAPRLARVLKEAAGL